MIENPEIRAKILDWQKRYNIQDGDPAIALLELVQFLELPARSGGGGGGESGGGGGTVTAQISSESVSEAMKASLLPIIERVAFQSQELQQKFDRIDFEKFVKQIEAYHEGIDYCTKKLDVVKKETDALVIRVDKTAAQIRPITRSAVLALMVVALIVGAIAAKIWGL